MIQLFFFFTWAFWQWFFIVLGIIFCLLLIGGAIVCLIIQDFDDVEHSYQLTADQKRLKYKNHQKPQP